MGKPTPGHAVEVFYRWCVWEGRRALSSQVEGHLGDALRQRDR